ncbi:hypothetical protein [Paraburkholderia phytofirmans]|uniref:Uncharacterized protein n=1 Tax=Paraburkholderia phytofirmans TaxID=261302 RepID=A0ABW9BGH6_9BURK
MHWIDPECLQETRGTVTRFLLNPHGELDGLILDNERQVHFPPHLSKLVAKHVSVGDKVRVRGVKPRAADIVAAVQLTSATGIVILDEGPHHHGERHEKPHADKRAMEVTGEVELSLYGPKGELRGALLTDGTSIRMPPHAAENLSSYLAPGAHIQVWGHGVKNRHGKTIDVDDIAELVDAEDLPATAE